MTRSVRDNAPAAAGARRPRRRGPRQRQRRGARLFGRSRARREGPDARPHPALLCRGHAGPSRAGAGDREARRRCCAGLGATGARDPAGAARATMPPARASSFAARPLPSTGAGWPSVPATTAISRASASSTGAAVSAADYIDALRLRARLTRRTLEAFAGIDAALDGLQHGPGLPHRRCRGLRPRLSAPGAPALQRHGTAGHRHSRRLHARTACRCRCSSIGHPFQEAMVYRIAQAYERATGWTERHPPGL